MDFFPSVSGQDYGDSQVRQGAGSQGGVGDALLTGFGFLDLLGEGRGGGGEKEIQTSVEGTKILQEQDLCGETKV